MAIKKRQRVTYSNPIDRYPDGRKDWAKAINDFRQDIILRHNGGEDVEVYLRPLQTVSMHYKSTHFPAFNEKLRGREYIFPLPQEFQSRFINAVLQKKGAAATVLLRPSQPQRPERDSLLRPAAASSTNARQLLRPSEEVQVGPSQTRWQKIKERAARLNPFKKRR
ncbi:hypothetical protein HY995_00500 [Candidatus Micrarchaeota archaeon]|nr:hypothetical protein [Candidatus Micrarchaeota archaeon]